MTHTAVVKDQERGWENKETNLGSGRTLLSLTTVECLFTLSRRWCQFQPHCQATCLPCWSGPLSTFLQLEQLTYVAVWYYLYFQSSPHFSPYTCDPSTAPTYPSCSVVAQDGWSVEDGGALFEEQCGILFQSWTIFVLSSVQEF